MSDTVKLIVTLSKGQYENLKDIQFGSIGSRMIFNAVKNGIPLDNIDSNETKAYFDGQAYGWEEGRKALIEDLKAEIKEKSFTEEIFDEETFISSYTENVTRETAEEESVIETEIVKLSDVLDILDNIGKGDSK